LFELQANKDDFEKQLVWSHVKDARDIVTTCEEDLDAARHSSAQRAAQIEEMKATMESHKPTVKRLEQESNAYAQNIQADLAEINKLKHRAKQAKDRAKSKKKEVGTMNRSKQEKATEIKDMQEDIEQRQREQSQPSGGGTDQGKLAQDLQDAEASLTATQERHQQLQSQLEEVGDRDELFKKAQKKYSQEVASEKKQAERAKRDVQYQQKNAQNTNARFGEDIARLMDRVEQNARRFQRKPIGPVGAFVQLKDQKWATAAEVAIGPRALRTIIVHSSADEQLMEKMIKAAGVRRNNIFLCRMAIDDRSYQETGKLKTSTFPSSNFTNVMDVITVSNVAVQNFLWDQQVYRNLLFTNDKAAAATAHGNQQRNVKRCYDLEGSQYWKTGNSKSTMPFDSSNMRNLLASDASQLTRRLERQLAAAQDAMRECEQKWLQEQRQFLVDGKTPQQISAQIKKEFVALAKEQGRLGRKIDKLLEQQHDEEGEADEARLRAEEIQTLTQATQRCEDEIEQIEGSIVEHQRELDALETQYTQAEEETAEFKRQSDSRHGQQEQIFADLDLAKKKEGKLKRKLAEFERESKESRVAVNKADKDCAAAQKLVEDETRKARQFCEMEEEVTPTKSTAQLEKKILMIEERLKRAAKRQGGRSLDDITHDRDKAHKALQAFATVADNLVALNDLIHKSFKQRKKTYRIFRRNSANWSRKMFNKNLAKKGHHGDISFDHKNNTLDLKVMLGQDGAAEGGRAVTNTRTLSGGEKSFTTLCLLLALGTVTDVPFAIFDEIDVYMDDVRHSIMCSGPCLFLTIAWLLRTSQSVARRTNVCVVCDR
jgi:chromosome segregation ATPase